MQKLELLVGKWAGEATVQTGPGAPIKVKQTEDVRFKLGGVVLLIEGTGRGKKKDSDEEDVLFNALATVGYEAESKKYQMRAYRLEGQSVDVELTVKDDGFVWEITPGKVRVRYTATVKDDTWTEIGEVSLDGKTWNKVLEMNLKRVKE
jgi:hypothetical protein